MPTLFIGGTKFDVFQGSTKSFSARDLSNGTLILSKDRTGNELDGEYSITGNEAELRELFTNWLGADVSLSDLGVSKWQGFVIGMTFQDAFDRERISYDGLYNAVGATVINLVENPSLENNLAHWVVDAGGTATASIVLDSANSPQAIELTSQGVNEARISQEIDVLPETNYRLRFQSKGDGSQEGYFDIFDVTNAVFIVDQGTGNSDAEYKTVTYEFSTSPTTVRIRIRFRAPMPSNTESYYDDISLVRLREGEVQKTFIDFATNDSSIERFGRIEHILDFRDKSPLEAIEERDNFLVKHSQPKLLPPVDTQFITIQNETNLESIFGSPPPIIDNTATLTVEFAGYFTTAFWKIILPNDYNVRIERSTLIEQLISLATYLTPLLIETDTTLVAYPQEYTTVGDALVEIMNNDITRRLTVTPFLEVSYESLPEFTIIKFRDKYLRASGDSNPIDPFTIEPGITIRNLNVPDRSQHDGSYLLNNNQYIVSRWSMKIDGIQAEKTLQTEI